VPGWAKDPKAGPPLFNARCEDVAEKATFRNAVKKRRALVPATGYYEWRAAAGTGQKHPYYFELPASELMLFAGLYEWWRNPSATDDAPDKWLLSTTIVTRAATGSLAEIHDRMPVFLDADLVEEWLDPATEGGQDLVDEVVARGGEVAERVEFYPVGAAVGSVQNNGEELISPIS
jgi:putative SOS response-associated peptidase YedK